MTVPNPLNVTVVFSALASWKLAPLPLSKTRSHLTCEHVVSGKSSPMLAVLPWMLTTIRMRLLGTVHNPASTVWAELLEKTKPESGARMSGVIAANASPNTLPES